jgi:hypothetical protein
MPKTGFATLRALAGARSSDSPRVKNSLMVGVRGLELFCACDKIRLGGLRKAAKQGKLKQPPAVFAYRFES